MSWEEVEEKRVVCPCGKGFISQKIYGDDWNRIKNGAVVIECEDCKAKYIVESKDHSSHFSWDGNWTEYFLTPIDYPPYSGIEETDIFGPIHNNLNEISFVDFIIERFSQDDLIQAKKEYVKIHNSSKVSGIAKKIRKAHKMFFNSVKCASIIAQLETAINQYASYLGSYDRRLPIRERETKERREYEIEKKKHQIRLDL